MLLEITGLTSPNNLLFYRFPSHAGSMLGHNLDQADPHWRSIESALFTPSARESTLDVRI